MSGARKAYKAYQRKKPSINERALWHQVLTEYDGHVERAAHAWSNLYERVHGKPPEPMDDRPEDLFEGR